MQVTYWIQPLLLLHFDQIATYYPYLIPYSLFVFVNLPPYRSNVRSHSANLLYDGLHFLKFLYLTHHFNYILYFQIQYIYFSVNLVQHCIKFFFSYLFCWPQRLAYFFTWIVSQKCHIRQSRHYRFRRVFACSRIFDKQSTYDLHRRQNASQYLSPIFYLRNRSLLGGFVCHFKLHLYIT